MFTLVISHAIINLRMVSDMMKIFRKAILIVHGFAGGTYDEEELANFLELNRNFDVFQFTLPGHEKNLSKANHLDWIKKSEEKIEWLIQNGYNNIYVIGHSMGGVIATYLAVKYKEVKKLVLAAPAFQYLKVIKEKINLIDSLKATPKVVKTYGGDEIIARLLKLGPGAVKEFMNLTKEYYDYPNEVTCPLLIIQGKNDNLVPLSSSKYVYDSAKSDFKKLIYVESLTHDVFRGEDSYNIYKIVERFLKKKINANEKGVYDI